MTAPPADPQGFAELRARFHQLLELPAEQRAQALARCQTEEPALADQLQSLLDALDPDDLQPALSVAVPDEQIAGYQFIRRIGSGGMGEVWEAARSIGTTRQRVAIKLIHSGRVTAEMRERFLREHRILARLSHPHIAAFIDAGIAASGRAWLAMEFVEGENLARWCRATPSIEARVERFLQVCAAVQFAHLHLVVHRDLKPANVMVSALAGAKLLDFGIAKLLDDSEADLTHTGLQVMTARYAAPEQIGGGTISVGTDVYALGVLLFEMVAGCSPYARAESGAQSFATAVLNEPVRPLGPLLHGKLARRRIGDLELILGRAMAKAASERYASAAALADDLGDWLVMAPMRSGIGGGGARLRHLLRHYRWALATVGAVMLAILLGAGLALQQARRAEHEAARADNHMTALLDVIGSANPGVYAGREPLASELLLAASKRLQEDAADDPELLRRTLSEIGHGLLNLGQSGAAEGVLLAAVRAMDQEVDTPPARALGLLKLLALAQDSKPAIARLRTTAARIEQLANSGTAPAGVAIDALASAAGTLSRVNAFEEAEHLFAIAERLLRQHPLASLSELENFHRQRGWAALRAAHFESAYASFQQSLLIIARQPSAFAPLRRAEAQWLLAEAALGFDATLAVAPMQAARSVVLQHYSEGHSERAQWQLLEARADLAGQRFAEAAAMLSAAEAVLEHADDAAHALLQLGLLRARLELAGHDCAAARQRLDAWSAPIDEPRLAHLRVEIQAEYASACGQQ